MPRDLSRKKIDFKNRRVLVTGAGKGIGRDTAVMLARYQARVVAVSRTEADLINLKDEIACETIIADLGDAAAANRAAEHAGDIDRPGNTARIAVLQRVLVPSPEA